MYQIFIHFNFNLKVNWSSLLASGEEPLAGSGSFNLSPTSHAVGWIQGLADQVASLRRVGDSPLRVTPYFQNAHSWECKPWISIALSGRENEDVWLAQASGPFEKQPVLFWNVADLGTRAKVSAVVLARWYYWLWPSSMVIEHSEGHLRQYLRTNSSFKLSCWFT